MNDLTDEQRARALEMRNTFAYLIGMRATETLPAGQSHAWLAVEARVLASHTCPDAESDVRVRAWNAIAQHPFFADCYQTEGTLVDAMVAKLDAAHTHTCEPVWRPVINGEDLTGHEVRARSNNGDSWSAWGVAYRRNLYGNWVTKGGAVLTGGGHVTETTAPLPEPEPEPDPRVDLLEGVCLREGVVLIRSDAALLLSIADAVEPPKAGA